MNQKDWETSKKSQINKALTGLLRKKLSEEDYENIRKQTYEAYLDGMGPRASEWWDHTGQLRSQARRNSDVPLQVLGHQGSEEEIVTALQIGADAYVKLPCDMSEIMARISCLLRRAGTIVREDDGKSLLSSCILLNPATHEVFTGDQWVMLTPTQFRLLNRLLSDASAAEIQESRDNKTKAAPEHYAQVVSEINGRPFKESVEPQLEIEHPLPVEPQQEIEPPLPVETEWDYLLVG